MARQGERHIRRPGSQEEDWLKLPGGWRWLLGAMTFEVALQKREYVADGKDRQGAESEGASWTWGTLKGPKEL